MLNSRSFTHSRDGNGRISRLLIPLFLYEKELIAQPAFYPSAYLERHWDAYMAALTPLNDRNGDWNAWTLFFLQATATQADEAAGMAESVMRLHEELRASVVDSTHSQFAALLLDAMFERPVFKQAAIAERLAKTTGSAAYRSDAIQLAAALGERRHLGSCGAWTGPARDPVCPVCVDAIVDGHRMNRRLGVAGVAWARRRDGQRFDSARPSPMN